MCVCVIVGELLLEHNDCVYCCSINYSGMDFTWHVKWNDKYFLHLILQF